MANLHPQTCTEPCLDRGSPRALTPQSLGGLELHVFIQVSDHAHRGALVHDFFHRGRQRDVFDIKFRNGQAVFRQSWCDVPGHQLTKLTSIGSHVQHRNARTCDGARKLLHDNVADLETDFIHREFAIGSDDLNQKLRRICNAYCIGPEGPQSHWAKLRIAADHRVLRAPFQVCKPCGVDEIDLGFERRPEAMIPMLQRGHDRHVVGLKHVKTGCEHIRQLTFMHKYSGLSFAHGQLGAVFDFMAFTLEPPDHRVASVIDPMDDVDELT